MRFPTVVLRNHGIRESVPRKVIAQKQSRHSDVFKLLVAGIIVRNEISLRQTVDSDQIAHAKSEQPAELLEPTTIEYVRIIGSCRAAIFMLRIFTPDDQWN